MRIRSDHITWRARAALFAAALGAASAVAPVATPAGAAAATTTVSTNWAGYAASGRHFRRVSASWTIQSASCTGGQAASSAAWIGLGGFAGSSQSLEQTGTETDCASSGRASYSAWYELVPATAKTVRLRVRPGNRISALVEVRSHRVTMALHNRSTGATIRKVAAMSSPDVSSADWIVEAPEGCDASNNCGQLPLADFGSVRFSGARATGASGHSGPISDPLWTTTALILRAAGDFGGDGVARVSGAGAVPSGLSSGGSAFSVSYSSSTAGFGKAQTSLPALARRAG